MFKCDFNEDGSATMLAVLGAVNGTGDVIGSGGLGKWLKQADFSGSTIDCKVYDVTGADTLVQVASANPTCSISSSIVDTPTVDGAAWSLADNPLGYNFVHTIAPGYFPTGGSIYRVEYLATLTGGTHQLPWSYQGVAKGRSST